MKNESDLRSRCIVVAPNPHIPIDRHPDCSYEYKYQYPNNSFVAAEQAVVNCMNDEIHQQAEVQYAKYHRHEYDPKEMSENPILRQLLIASAPQHADEEGKKAGKKHDGQYNREQGKYTQQQLPGFCHKQVLQKVSEIGGFAPMSCLLKSPIFNL